MLSLSNFFDNASSSKRFRLSTCNQAYTMNPCLMTSYIGIKSRTTFLPYFLQSLQFQPLVLRSSELLDTCHTLAAFAYRVLLPCLSLSLPLEFASVPFATFVLKIKSLCDICYYVNLQRVNAAKLLLYCNCLLSTLTIVPVFQSFSQFFML